MKHGFAKKMKLIIASALMICAGVVQAATVNGFEFTALDAVQVAEPSCAYTNRGDSSCESGVLYETTHAAASESIWRGDTQVLGVVVKGQPIAYPLAMLLWHWVINDEVNGEPIVVAFCRVCGSGAVYQRTVGDEVLNFGTSGLVYENDMLLYDEKSLSLWSWGSQLAVAGPRKGKTLELLTSNQQRLSDWLELHPASLVASSVSENQTKYEVTPNGTSAFGDSVYSGLQRTLGQLPSAMPVLLVEFENQSIGFPASEVLTVGKVQLDRDKGPFFLEFDVNTQKFGSTGAYKGKRMTIAELLSNYPEAGVFKANSIADGGAE